MDTGHAKDYSAIAEEYCRDVLSVKIIACKWTKLACRRHLEDLKRKTTKKWPYYFDHWWANDVCDFAEKVPHHEGNWNPDGNKFILEPWEVFILVAIFGWRRRVQKAKDPKNDPRRFSAAYIEVARKNGKSPISAIVALYCVACEGENAPQVKLAATTYKQTEAVFKPAKAMVNLTPALREHFQLEARAKAIACFSSRGNIEPIHSKSQTQDGLNPHATIIDELHAHKDRSLFDVLRSAKGARKNPLSWYITTAGYNLEGVCYEQRTLVTKILEGIIPGDHYFGVIYTLDDGDDPFDEKVWLKSNPNLGVSVQIKDLRDYAQEAKASPKSLGEYKTKRHNIWCNAAAAWLNLLQWDACADPGLKIDDFTGYDCWIGGDLADRNDIAGYLLLFLKDGLPYLFPRFYLPEDLVLEKMHSVGMHYKVWADEGLLILTPGDFIDHNRIEEDVRKDWEKFNVHQAAFDQYGSAQLAASLNNDGLTTAIVHKNAKTYGDPSLELEARVKTGRIRHDGNKILRWMVSNAVVDRRVDGSILPKKENKDSPNKIDGLDMAILALGQAMVFQGPIPYDYDARDILYV